MSKRFKLIIEYVFIVGLLISLLLTISGGAYYVFQEGRSVKSYHAFQTTAQLDFKKMWMATEALSPIGMIQMGILVLIFAQLVRIVLLTLYYMQRHDVKFMLLSLFIIAIMILSFWLKV